MSASVVSSAAGRLAETARDEDVKALARLVQTLAGIVANVQATAKDAVEQARRAKGAARR